ncbi:hypothetical protein SAMN04515656_10328 [Eubacterium aggregans]|uniref:Uncharacterized protein n=1 Tax=Eubacterium aggregans TaxID=81409 RepID=A0A1H3Y429_9FIRM|nr:hypothetical protein [Eubacterium aggregans]SEA05578.1 hypothetical protein SAMN04515656_10328 [Eubacterium aggregans]
MIIVGRHIEGIALNDLEYLLDADGNELMFDSIEDAKEHLVEIGMPEEEMYYLKFVEVEAENE